MNRLEAMTILAPMLEKDDVVISANGYISRDLCHLSDRRSNFYMIGSMGLASSIGVGVALGNPRRRVIVFDGDGNILMNLGSLVVVGAVRPVNFYHVVLDNESHESTGGQPTYSKNVDLAGIASLSGYNRALRVEQQSELEPTWASFLGATGPNFLLIKISKGGTPSPRVPHSTTVIRDRFASALRELPS